MAYISQIKLPSGTTYDIKDTEARNLIENLTSYTDYLGVSTTAITDGAAPDSITVGGKVYAKADLKAGNIVNYGSKEFIWNGTVWQEFGDLTGLGELAHASQVTGSTSYTPAGTVGVPEFMGTDISYTPEGDITISDIPVAGTVSQPTFSGTSKDFKTNVSASGSFTATGTVSTPTITVTPSTTVVTEVTNKGTLPNFKSTVDGEVLEFTWSAGTLPTTDDVTVMTGASASSSKPTFTGTSNQTINVTGAGSGSFTPEGTVSQPTFTGTEVKPTVGFTGKATILEVDGTNTAPSFTGTAATITITSTKSV